MMTWVTWLLLLALPADRVVDASPAKIMMPYAVEEKQETDEVTPWGKAQATNYSTTNPDKNIFYWFTIYNFHKKKKHSADLLKKAPAYFLLNKKCIAKTIKQPPVPDFNGRTWPQIAFEGHCVSPHSDYRVLVLMADHQVYQFHVGYLPYPKNPELLKKGDLDKAIKELVGRFSISKEVPSGVDKRTDAPLR